MVVLVSLIIVIVVCWLFVGVLRVIVYVELFGFVLWVCILLLMLMS